MSKDDWYRRTTWTKKDEEEFFLKLKRARNKCQYLRIQADYLVKKHPDAALELLDQYQSMCTDETDVAAAHVTRAEALLSLDRLNEALNAYRAAIQCEEEFPNFQTGADLELSFLIATRGLAECYDEAATLLAKYPDPAFPIEEFKLHASLSLIANETGDHEAASKHSKAALRAADKEHSGIAYHAKLGLVRGQYRKLRKRLKTICQGEKIKRFKWIPSFMRSD